MNRALAIRKLVTAWLVIGLAAVSVWVGAGSARAECEPPVSLDVALTRSRVVFIGRVLALADQNRTATVDVDWVWKGRDLPAQVIVSGITTDTGLVDTDDRIFRLGSTYLFLPESVESPFQESRCTATLPYSAGTDEIPREFHEAVGAEVARPAIQGAAPDAGSAFDSGLFRIAIAGVLGLLLVLFVIAGYGRLTRTETDKMSVLAAQRQAAAAETEPAPSPGKSAEELEREQKRLAKAVVGRSAQARRTGRYRRAGRRRRRRR